MRWPARWNAPVSTLVLVLAALAGAADPGEWSTVSEHWYELLIDGHKAVIYRALKPNPRLGANFVALDPLEWLAQPDHGNGW